MTAGTPGDVVSRMKRLQETALKTQNTAQSFSDTKYGENKADVYFRDMRREVGIDCTLCDNTGYTLTVKNGLCYCRECRCMTVYRNKNRLKKSGLLKLIDIYTFDSYKTPDTWQRTIKKSALAFLERPEKWFYIGGAVGGGKTHICTAICGELLKRREVYYMPWRDDIVRIKANVNNDETYQELVGKLKQIEALYIDDLFKGGEPSEADKKVAFEILNYRYVNRLMTIISSERGVPELMEIDEAIGSRIFEMTQEFNYKIDGRNKNMRLRVSAQ